MLAERLSDDDPNVRSAAAEALGALGEHAKDQAPLLAERLSDDDPNVRSAAAEALGALGEHAKDQAPLLAERLNDDDPNVRSAAVKALSKLATPTVVWGDVWHETPDLDVAELLRELGEHAREEAPLLVEQLSDDDPNVRSAAVKTLVALGDHAKDQAPLLGASLDDDNPDLRVAATKVLVALGEHAKDLARSLGALLNDDDPDVRITAAKVLGALGEHAKDEVPLLIERLSDVESVRSAAVEALGELGPLEMDLMPSILTHLYTTPSRTGEIRFLAHFLGGGGSNVETLLAWLGEPHAYPIEVLKQDPERAAMTLVTFGKIWPQSEPYRRLRIDLAAQIAKISANINWNEDALPLLEEHEVSLRGAGFTAYANAIQQEIDAIKVVDWAWLSSRIWFGHIVFWLLLIFVYPKFPQVQAIFFWNRWVRWIVGLGYVGFLLAWVPFLRRRLFAPFRDALLADARLAEFREQDYFPDSLVRRPDGELSVVTATLTEIRGQAILEGESGLGKSMFLRHLVRDYQHLVVFLNASDCDLGVLEAIQAKLEGPARDPDYLRKLIYAGAIDVVIDGLNEVSASTQAGIVEFARRFFRGNLLLATQPMVWEPPPLAKTYVMQPLADTQIEAFLIGRYSTLLADAEMTADSFAAGCREYIRGVLTDRQLNVTHNAARVVLSNPMDLSIVAQMLARKQIPNLFELQHQHFRLMAEDYEHRHAGNSFPLKGFAERVYEMRVKDASTFIKGDFANELVVMARHKMVVPYHEQAAEAETAPLWTFRHDKIMDFFLVQAFLGPNNQRPRKHLGDPRFRGTYLQLAGLLPLDAAKALERQLVDYAADTRDHSVSDDFVQLLRPRKAA